ncbi:MAG TPA: glycogen/starch synthase, partial [bacterium]|nr:glycogen/starch synthase [bacterium]
MKIAVVASEVVPFAKTGGLADVSGSLPPALEELGQDVCVFMPKYRTVVEQGLQTEPTGVRLEIPIGGRTLEGSVEWAFLPNSSVKVYLVANDEFFDRPQLYGESGLDYVDNLERFAFFCRGVLQFLETANMATDI